MKISKLALATLGALMAMGAQAGQYVLQAPKWGAAQQAAVAKAGGTVKFAHDGAGMAVVQSDNPNFLAAVKAGGAVTSGALDMVVQWTQPDGWDGGREGPGRSISHGTIAFQGHDPKSVVQYKNVQIKILK